MTAETVPICAPFNFTFAPRFMSRPARSAITVTGTVSVNVAAEHGDGEGDDRRDREDGDQTDHGPPVAPGAEVPSGLPPRPARAVVAALHGERLHAWTHRSPGLAAIN